MERDRTVIMLGAGASRASRYQLPCIKGFFAGGKLSSSLKAGLKRVYGANVLERLADVNVEDLLTHIEMTRQFRQGARDAVLRATDYIEPLRRDLFEYIGTRIEIPSPVEASRSDGNLPGYPSRWTPILNYVEQLHRALFDGYFGKQTQSESVGTALSTNYDLVADYALLALEHEKWRGSLQRTRKLRYLRNGKRDREREDNINREGWYLKLHGSLDWVHCSNPDCSKYQRVFSPVFDHEWAAGEDALPEDYDSQIECQCGFAYKRLIVPPTFSKTYGEYPGIERLWRIAVQELEKANKVVIIGLSFAPSDVRLAWLMRHSLRDFGTREIDLVYLRTDDEPDNQDRHPLVERIRSFAPSATVKPYPCGFEDYLREKGWLLPRSCSPA